MTVLLVWLLLSALVAGATVFVRRSMTRRWSGQPAPSSVCQCLPFCRPCRYCDPDGYVPLKGNGTRVFGMDVIAEDRQE